MSLVLLQSFRPHMHVPIEEFYGSCHWSNMSVSYGSVMRYEECTIPYEECAMRI